MVGVVKGRTTPLTWDNARPKDDESNLISTDNAEAGGSIPPSPTKGVVEGHFWPGDLSTTMIMTRAQFEGRDIGQ
jgi:hypothetical protein